MKLTFDVDANGRVLEGVEPEVENTMRSTQAGVVLTIDSRVQYAAETVAANAADIYKSGDMDRTDLYYLLYYIALNGAGVSTNWEEILAN